MTPEALKEAVNALMADVSTMTLATCNQNMPRATDVYFANDGFDLLFYSSPNTEHSRNLAANPNCSATVHPIVSGWKEIKGIRVDGIALPAEDEALRIRARDAYLKKFPFAAPFLNQSPTSADSSSAIALYVLRASGLTYIDNAQGFGTKFFVPVIDGKFADNPCKVR